MFDFISKVFAHKHAPSSDTESALVQAATSAAPALLASPAAATLVPLFISIFTHEKAPTASTPAAVAAQAHALLPAILQAAGVTTAAP